MSVHSRSVSPELATIASLLQEAAQKLLRLSVPLPSSKRFQEKMRGRPQGIDVLRTYRIPHYILEDEQILLDHYGVDRFADAVNRIHDEFFLVLLLMKGHDDDDVEGFTLQLIGEHLSGTLRMLSKASSILTDFKLIEEQEAR